jgi:hypothetical protein
MIRDFEGTNILQDVKLAEGETVIQSLYISYYVFGINQYRLSCSPYYMSTVVTPNQVVPPVLYRHSLFCLTSYFSPIPLCTGRALQLTFSHSISFEIRKSFLFRWTQAAETVLSHIFAILHR